MATKITDASSVKILRSGEHPQIAERRITSADSTHLPENCKILPMEVLKTPERIRREKPKRR